MPAPISMDLRRRILERYNSSLDSAAEVAQRYNVGEATVSRLVARYKKTGSIEPKTTRPNTGSVIDDDGLRLIKEMVNKDPDAIIDELTYDFNKAKGMSVSTSTMSRALLRLGLTRKKKTLVASERMTERIQDLREKFLAWQRGVDAGRLFFLDEAGSTIAMTRTYGRCPRGERLEEAVPRNRGDVITMVGALTKDGLGPLMTFEGGTSGDAFLAYIEKVLSPHLRPGDGIVLDNLGAHRDARVREAVKKRGCKLYFLPPYSPDLNPIELAWAKLKQLVKVAKARCRDSLDIAIAMASDMISANDAKAWIRHCGYIIP